MPKIKSRCDQSVKNKINLGWREWLALPELGIQHIKCKIDTGARTSTIHADFIQADTASGIVRFGIPSNNNTTSAQIICEEEIVDQRKITDSGGHPEIRYVIRTPVTIAENSWPIEITLTNRDNMRFKMLLGRTAMKGRLQVDPGRSFLLGKPPKKFR